MRRIVLCLTAVCTAALLAQPAGAQQTESWDFSGVTRIEFDGTSGDVVLLPAEGSTGRVELTWEVTPSGAFRGEVEVRGEVVDITERWSGQRSNGRVTWRIHVPRTATPVRFAGDTASGALEVGALAVSLRFRTASGDLAFQGTELGSGSRLSTASGDVELTGMSVVSGIRFSTASGDVDLTDVEAGEDVEFSTASGDVHLERVNAGPGTSFSTASGDVEARDCRGVLRLGSASGDVDVRDCELAGEGRFSSASGDVEVALARLPGYELRVSSASGDAALRVADWGESFRLVLEKRKDRGALRCPFPSTTEEEFEENDRTYIRVTVVRGSGGPEILVKSASGSVTVR